MWKLGLRLRYSHKRNTLIGFSLQCGVSSIADYLLLAGVSDAVSDPAVSSVPVVAFVPTELLMFMLLFISLLPLV
jgi:hypothetical protein